MESRFPDLRSVRWRINLGVLPSDANSTIDDLRRVTADSRRRYASLRRSLLIDPHIIKFSINSPDLVTDNPLSQNPDSTWSRFFQNAELEKMVEKDLSRLYPEHGSYFQTPGCQGLLRRILLLWCLQHPECGYRQGMHELLAPLIYVLHTDIQHLIVIRKRYEDHFVDKFDEDFLNENLGYNFKISEQFCEEKAVFQEKSENHPSSTALDPNLQSIVLLSDPYGADGELGVVLSEKFIEHDAYGMFDALMNGSGGDMAMADFFSHSPAIATQTGLPPVIEASMALYHLLSIVDHSLYSHLNELGVEPQYFALRWLRVLFGREFSLEDLLIIWDEMFSFNNIKTTSSEHDSGVLNSPRGAFISAMGVSMMLNVRSSLLATELATSCLQRLLNFPEHVDLDKLIRKAKSLVPLALDVNVPSYVKEVEAKKYTDGLSFNSSSQHAPLNIVPERFWEEKWRLLQKEEETKEVKCIQQASPKRGWTEKIKLKLSRRESNPSLPKMESRYLVEKPAVRRCLLEDLSRQLDTEKDTKKDQHDTLPFQDPFSPKMGLLENKDLGPCTAGEEQAPAFSDPTSPLDNDLERSSNGSNISHDVIDCESENSCSFQSTTEEPPLPISDAPDLNACWVSGGSHDSSSERSVVAPKDRKTLSGKFQWLWMFGRRNSSEGTSGTKSEVVNEKLDDFVKDQRNKAETCISKTNDFERVQIVETETCVSETNYGFERVQRDKAETCITEINSDIAGIHIDKAENSTSDTNCDFESAQKDKVETSIGEMNCDSESIQRNNAEKSVSQMNGDYVNLKTDGCDEKLVFALRNLGLSMLENIQVIESAFHPERSQASSQSQPSKHALVEKGQVTAMTALKELRKISNLLREV